MSAESIITEEARLIILRQLNEQSNNSMSSAALQRVLHEMFMIVWERNRVEQELAWLAEKSAVRLTDAGSVVIAQLRDAGRWHLAHEKFIAGVQRSTFPLRAS